ncbi:Ricin-type beta-trefoil lectin domain-like [Actinoplanes regularis]|uniref:Ricin-type beta-trefoil lectin domain-like n=2 Tax=Actinoplanes regularis TaxID=52697 RepID=A0A238XK93_9ACTN|nr:hypothetical protein Are01nite_70050 [Actinoplanes regularis]SNR59120.1 Ricin-type beta-trefoil lectin domain-like [Actinoplanes regularis]
MLCALVSFVWQRGHGFVTAARRSTRVRWLTSALAVLVGVGTGVVAAAPQAWAALPTGQVAIGLGSDSDLRVLSSGTSSSTAVVAAPYTAGVSGTTILAQRWTLDMTIYVEEEITAGYKIKNAQTGQCLGRTATANNSPVIAKACSNEVAQLWTVPATAPNGGVQLQNMADYRCLDLAGGSTAANAPLRVSTCNSASTAWWQRWKLRYGTFSCDRRSNQRLLTGLCVSGSMPMTGAFGTWRNLPASYTPEARTQPNDLDNFIELRSRNSSNEDNQADGIEFGLHQALVQNAAVVHPYWTEWGPGGQEYHSVLNSEGGTAADGRNHSYMLMPTAAGGQWDVLYDFNLVGTTTRQEGAQFRDAYANLAVANPSSVSTAEAFQNRLQLYDVSGVWHRPYLTETSRTEPKTCSALPTDADPLWSEFNAPPWCMTTGLVTRNTTPVTVDYMSVKVPRTGSGLTALAPPHPTATTAAGTVGGVNQQALRDCLEKSPDTCLDTVAGLQDCVSARRICSSPDVSRATAVPISLDQARRAVSRHLAPAAAPTSSTSRPVAALDARLRAELPTLPAGSQVHVMTGNDRVHGFGANAENTYDGYVMVYDAARSVLLYACLGADCPQATR